MEVAYFVDDEGTIWCCDQVLKGEGSFAYCGRVVQNPDTQKSPYQLICSPVEDVKWNLSNIYAISKEGLLQIQNDKDKRQRKISTITNESMQEIVSISTGYYHAMFLDRAGKVWGIGSNRKHQVGKSGIDLRPIAFTINIKMIATGSYHSLFLGECGTVWGCGKNRNGQLGIKRATNQPIRRPKRNKNLPIIQHICAGSNMSLFFDGEGSIWCCGRNSRGVLGHGDKKKNRIIPEKIPNIPPMETAAIGRNFMLLIENDNSVWGCGDNRFGQLWMPSPKTVRKPTKIPDLHNINSVVATSRCTYFIDKTGAVWKCGLEYPPKPRGSIHSLQIPPVSLRAPKKQTKSARNM